MTESLPEEVARDVELLTSNNYNFVSFQQDFSDDCGQTAEQMATAINYYGLKYDKMDQYGCSWRTYRLTSNSNMNLWHSLFSRTGDLFYLIHILPQK